MPHEKPISDKDRDVLRVLAAARRPLSAYEILDEVRPHGIRAPNQVYRALEKLGRAGLVHRIEALNAFVACNHRHAAEPGFVICRDCGTVQELEDDRLSAIAISVSRSGFAVDHVSLEIFGHCGKCRSRPEAAL